MRRLFTTSASGLSKDTLQWGVRVGRWQRVQRGIYADGPDAVTPLDRERAKVLAAGTEARGGLAGVLHRLDSVALDGRPTRRDRLPAERIVIGWLPGRFTWHEIVRIPHATRRRLAELAEQAARIRRVA
jgi:hypothetical protein